MTLKSPEMREALKAFVTEALACADPVVGQLRFDRFRLHNGKGFEVSDATIEAQQAFSRLAIKKLGPIKGHYSVIDKALWNFVSALEDPAKIDETKCLNDALDAIEARSATVCEFFRPCPLVALPTGIDRIDIGRVAVERTKTRVSEFQKINPQVKFHVGQDWSLRQSVLPGEGLVLATLPPIVWTINLAAADPIIEEEGLWLVDVALSLLRLALSPDDLGPIHPYLGKVEPHPFNPHDVRNNSFTLKRDGGASLGGMTAANRYLLESRGEGDFFDEETNEKFDLIFAAEPKRLSERFYQGCGWMTRGRRSFDRSDRLLYFFTAIEALLSDDDKTSPVSQTIARHAAALLTDENPKRHEISREIKKLYAVRSALVHSGSRKAFHVDTDTAQQVAEMIFQKVWDDIDLSMRHSDFSAMLGRASYGLSLKEAQV